jgi:hypothetical protein
MKYERKMQIKMAEFVKKWKNKATLVPEQVVEDSVFDLSQTGNTHF